MIPAPLTILVYSSAPTLAVRPAAGSISTFPKPARRIPASVLPKYI
jgi:hypothetical protein